MKTVTDTEIRIRLRGILAHLRLDMQRLRVCVAGGTVRFTGELNAQGRPREAVALAVVEALESDVARVKGIRNTFYELRNWRRTGPGEWIPLKGTATANAAQHGSFLPLDLDTAPRREPIPFERARTSATVRNERVW